MYKYSCSGFKDMLSEYEEMSTNISNEETEYRDIVSCIEKNWHGVSFDAFQNKSNLFLAQDYAKFINTVNGVKLTLDDSITELSKLREESEEIATTLGNVPTLLKTNIVTLDNEKKSAFRSGLDSIYSNNERLEEVLSGIVSSGSGIVDLSAESAQITNAYAKVNRMKAFDSALCSYARHVELFDANLVTEFGKYVDSSLEATGDEIEISKEYLELLNQLEANGMNIEEYYSAVFNASMYINPYDKHEVDGVVVYDPEKDGRDLLDSIANGEMTISRYVEELKGIDGIYRDEYKDFIDILDQAIKADPKLGDYKIVSTSRSTINPETGKPFNRGTNAFVFQDPETSAYYMAWRGTSGPEWVDDAERFGVKSADYEDYTTQMQEVITYFDEFMKDKTDADTIYVTGHSQGGNDAQICILLSDYGKLVDACYSMDGEGHSPELISSLKEKLGKEEYDARISKIFALNGYDDPVHNLGEKVILDENTIQIYCELSAGLVYCHDIRGMFCNPDGKVTFMINQSVEGTSSMASLGENLWKQLNTLSPTQRVECAVALLSLLQNFAFDEGFTTIDGTGPDLSDFFVLFNSGLDVIIDALGITAAELIRKKIYEITGNKILDTQLKLLIACYDYYGSLDNIPKAIISAIGSAAIDLAEEEIRTLIDMFTIYYNRLPEMWETIFDGGKDYFNVLSDLGRNEYKNVVDNLLKGHFIDFLTEQININWNLGSDTAKILFDTSLDLLKEGVGMTIDVVDRLIDNAKKTVDIVWTMGEDVVDGIVSGVKTIGNKVEVIIDDAKELGEEVVDWAEEKIEDAKDWTEDRIEDVKDWTGDRIDDVKDWVDDAGDWVGDRVDDIIDLWPF